MLQPLTRVLSCLAVVLLVAACQGPSDPPPPAGYGEGYPAPLDDPQISVLADDLRPWLRFQPAVLSRGDERPLAVQVPVRNISGRQYLIDYRILFYDEDGAEMAPQMSWSMVPLLPREIVRLKASALDTRARSYRLEVKWAR